MKKTSSLYLSLELLQLNFQTIRYRLNIDNVTFLSKKKGKNWNSLLFARPSPTYRRSLIQLRTFKLLATLTTVFLVTNAHGRLLEFRLKLILNYCHFLAQIWCSLLLFDKLILYLKFCHSVILFHWIFEKNKRSNQSTVEQINIQCVYQKKYGIFIASYLH